MSTILAAYSVSAFQEFYLPELKNSEYSIIIDSGVFSLPKSIILHLENIEGTWFFSGEDRYLYSETGKPVRNERLLEGSIFRIGPSKKLSWASIIITGSSNVIHAYRQIELLADDTITIGKNNDSAIQYNYLDLISGKHAEISCRQDGCYIQDNSRNGVFVGNIRIDKQWKLQFGDVISVFALRIIFLGNCIAVDANADGVILSSRLGSRVFCSFDRPNVETGRKSRQTFFKRSPRSI